MNWFGKTILPVISIIACSQLFAAESSYSLRAGIEHSDNIGRRASNTAGETMAYLGVNSSIEHQASDLELSADADVEFVSYTDGIFDDEILVNLSGDAKWWILQDRLNWEFHDSFGQIGTDPFASVTPINRENTNFFRTGPDLIFRIGVNEVTIGGRFVDDSYENSSSDNQRLDAHISASRPVAPGRTVNFDAVTERVEFDSGTFNSDFDKQRYSLGFTSNTSRSSLELSAGISEIHDYDKSFSTLFSRLRIERNLSEATALWFLWRSDFSDAGQSFRYLQGSGTRFSEVQNVIPVGDPFEMQNAEVGLNFASGATSGNFSGFWIDESYEVSTALNRQLSGIRFNINREFTRQVSGTFVANYLNSDFDNRNISFDNLYLSAALSIQLSRKLSGNVSYRRDRRGSDSSFVSEYAENRYGVGIVFRGR